MKAATVKNAPEAAEADIVTEKKEKTDTENTVAASMGETAAAITHNSFST